MVADPLIEQKYCDRALIKGDCLIEDRTRITTTRSWYCEVSSMPAST
jgi:hypothetical protein